MVLSFGEKLLSHYAKYTILIGKQTFYAERNKREQEMNWTKFGQETLMSKCLVFVQLLIVQMETINWIRDVKNFASSMELKYRGFNRENNKSDLQEDFPCLFFVLILFPFITIRTFCNRVIKKINFLKAVPHFRKQNMLIINEQATLVNNIFS